MIIISNIADLSYNKHEFSEDVIEYKTRNRTHAIFDYIDKNYETMNNEHLFFIDLGTDARDMGKEDYNILKVFADILKSLNQTIEFNENKVDFIDLSSHRVDTYLDISKYNNLNELNIFENAQKNTILNDISFNVNLHDTREIIDYQEKMIRDNSNNILGYVVSNNESLLNEENINEPASLLEYLEDDNIMQKYNIIDINGLNDYKKKIYFDIFENYDNYDTYKVNYNTSITYINSQCVKKRSHNFYKKIKTILDNNLDDFTCGLINLFVWNIFAPENNFNKVIYFHDESDEDDTDSQEVDTEVELSMNNLNISNEEIEKNMNVNISSLTIGNNQKIICSKYINSLTDKEIYYNENCNKCKEDYNEIINNNDTSNNMFFFSCGKKCLEEYRTTHGIEYIAI